MIEYLSLVCVISLGLNLILALDHRGLSRELKRERDLAELWHSRHVELARKYDKLHAAEIVRQRFEDESG